MAICKECGGQRGKIRMNFINDAEDWVPCPECNAEQNKIFEDKYTKKRNAKLQKRFDISMARKILLGEIIKGNELINAGNDIDGYKHLYKKVSESEVSDVISIMPDLLRINYLSFETYSGLATAFKLLSYSDELSYAYDNWRSGVVMQFKRVKEIESMELLIFKEPL